MAMMDQLLQMVKSSVMQHSTDQAHTGFDPSNLIGHIEELFGQHAAQQGGGNPQPASADRYGDPASQQRGGPGNVKPASADKYGDPADDTRH